MLFYNVWPLSLEESLIFRLYENYLFGFSGLHELKTSPLVIRTRTGFLTVQRADLRPDFATMAGMEDTDLEVGLYAVSRFERCDV